MSTIEERFWAKVDRRGPDECWEWTGHRLKAGYGRFGSSGRFPCGQSTHRIAWHVSIGAIPAGLMVCHRCDNPPCCNPAHLFLGMAADNTHDMLNKRRCPTGENHYSRTKPELVIRGDRHYLRKNPERVFGSANPFAKLDEDAVSSIKSELVSGRSQSAVARQFNVSVSTINLIARGKTWRHVA